MAISSISSTQAPQSIQASAPQQQAQKVPPQQPDSVHLSAAAQKALGGGGDADHDGDSK